METVILLSPNHFDMGMSAAQVSHGIWDTPYGDLVADKRAAEDLVGNIDVLAHEELAYDGEHGIGAIAPFVKRSFPNARMVPLVLHESLSDEDAREIGNYIGSEYRDSVVIASIDMSHNLPMHVQGYHDEVTMRSIMSAQHNSMHEIDSNASLRVLATVNEARGTEKWVQTHHGSSLDMGAERNWRDNTSHIIGHFEDGEAEISNFAAIHFVGDIMLDRGTRKQIDAHGYDYPWAEMERFLKGSDMVVGNLEGTVNEQASSYTYDPPFRFVFSPESVIEMAKHVDIVSLANNHTSDVGSAGLIETQDRLDNMGVPWFGGWATPDPSYDTEINGRPFTFVGYHQFQPNTSELVRLIEDADARERFVVVMPHWGIEYQHTPYYGQRELAEIMVDAGADLVVGGHPHVWQGIEMIDGVPVMYSLGNFVFDQQIPVTWPAITAGVLVSDNRIDIHLLPVYTKDSQPTPLSDQESAVLFEQLAGVSDPALETQITNGLITILYEM